MSALPDQCTCLPCARLRVRSRSVVHNTTLVYALLERREFISAHRSDSGAPEALANVLHVLTYFAEGVKARTATGAVVDGRLPETVADDGGGAALEVSDVVAAVEAAAQEWRGEGLRELPELRFTYEQEADAEEFFTPYIWTIAAEATDLCAEDVDGVPRSAAPAGPV